MFFPPRAPVFALFYVSIVSFFVVVERLVIVADGKKEQKSSFSGILPINEEVRKTPEKFWKWEDEPFGGRNPLNSGNE